MSTYTFDPISDPSANEGTYAYGINATNEIVGMYVLNHADYGFLENNGVYTTLADPQANDGVTSANGINDLGRSREPITDLMATITASTASFTAAAPGPHSTFRGPLRPMRRVSITRVKSSVITTTQAITASCTMPALGPRLTTPSQ